MMLRTPFIISGIFISGIFAAVLLAGCQQHARPAPVAADTQVMQLSSLVTAAAWLRDHCDRADIPQNDTLLQSALRQAKQRGWDTSHQAYQQINADISARYQALTADSVARKDKCAGLNQATAAFLKQMAASR